MPPGGPLLVQQGKVGLERTAPKAVLERLISRSTNVNISHSPSTQAALDNIRKRWLWVKQLFADDGYHRLELIDKTTHLDFVDEIIRQFDDQKGFEVLLRR